MHSFYKRSAAFDQAHGARQTITATSSAQLSCRTYARKMRLSSTRARSPVQHNNTTNATQHHNVRNATNATTQQRNNATQHVTDFVIAGDAVIDSHKGPPSVLVKLNGVYPSVGKAGGHEQVAQQGKVCRYQRKCAEEKAVAEVP